MKVNFRSLALLALALTSGMALAHGNQKHVVGTVEKIGADAVTVKTTDGKSVEVKLVAATRYVALGADKVAKPAKLADLQVGDRVVIHATPKGETLEAGEVRFSSTAARATGSKL
ncbi:MAG TPA: hypothetical protein VJN42_09700 [Candidatus Acidoferrum sp.]|nr:hypothetical protein [Candidatus Acidoferrum sp.]